MTLVDAHSFWVEGYFEETQLARIAIGDRATAVLLAYPDRALTGHVSGIGHGITDSDAAAGVQGLPAVNPVFTWGAPRPARSCPNGDRRPAARRSSIGRHDGYGFRNRTKGRWLTKSATPSNRTIRRLRNNIESNFVVCLSY